MVVEYLQSFSSLPLVVSWTENKRSYLSFRKEKRKILLRLHAFFQKEPPFVLEALMRYILKKDLAAKAVFRKAAYAYFSTHSIESENLIPKGNVYNLQEIYEEIRQKFFSSSYNAVIGWGKRGGGGRFRHMTFGTYNRYRNQILIHPLLDDKEVPFYFISFIVYHEMLHAVCLPEVNGRGHIVSHTKEFRQKERLFPQFCEAKAWEKQSLHFFQRKAHGRS